MASLAVVAENPFVSQELAVGLYSPLGKGQAISQVVLSPVAATLPQEIVGSLKEAVESGPEVLLVSFEFEPDQPLVAGLYSPLGKGQAKSRLVLSPVAAMSLQETSGSLRESVQSGLEVPAVSFEFEPTQPLVAGLCSSLGKGQAISRVVSSPVAVTSLQEIVGSSLNETVESGPTQ